MFSSKFPWADDDDPINTLRIKSAIKLAIQTQREKKKMYIYEENNYFGQEIKSENKIKI